jgi:MSHA biogenesis protein MshE
MPTKRLRLGDLLVQQQIITEDDLNQALAEQKKTGRRLGATLIQMGLVSERKLLTLLAEQLKIPFIELSNYPLDVQTVRKLSEIQARRYRALVLQDDAAGYLVGLTDPTDIYAVDELQNILQKVVKVAVIRETDWLNAIDTLYRKTDEIGSIAEELDDALAATDIDLAALESGDDLESAPVVRLLKTLFEDAVHAEASDIHIEPEERKLRIRQRVDGVLQEQVLDEPRIAPALVLRLKIMSGLDISEKRLPQDGRFNIRVNDHNVDVRISTMPVENGEAVVMRLLDQSRGIYNMKELGMPEDIQKRFESLVHIPHGLVLVTGPTGSGKSTTLYSALKDLNSPGKKIITAEDPVEYRLNRVNQVQVRSKFGLTFAKILRSALRQDPDIILIGEMRDQETAEIALRAAMTGHLVLSTLHTNDAITTALRLMDMGAEPYLVASSLKGVLAQRLVRRICDHCKVVHNLEDSDKIWLNSQVLEIEAGHTFYHGKGCHHCNQTGYKGRVGIYELLEIDSDTADALRRGDLAGFASSARRSKGFKPLLDSAMECARAGTTTLDEVFRVVEAMEE